MRGLEEFQDPEIVKVRVSAHLCHQHVLQLTPPRSLVVLDEGREARCRTLGSCLLAYLHAHSHTDRIR